MASNFRANTPGARALTRSRPLKLMIPFRMAFQPALFRSANDARPLRLQCRSDLRIELHLGSVRPGKGVQASKLGSWRVATGWSIQDKQRSTVYADYRR